MEKKRRESGREVKNRNVRNQIYNQERGVNRNGKDKTNDGRNCGNGNLPDKVRKEEFAKTRTTYCGIDLSEDWEW